MKKLGIKGIIGIAVGVVIILLAGGFAAVMLLRVDPAEAQNIALSQTGGGEIVSQEVSSEGLWNEYSYTIVNGDTWYEIEIGGFGGIEGIESGSGGARYIN